MRQSLLLFFIILVTASLNNLAAQDLIVTNEGDSINCKITKIKTDHIYFTFKHKGEIRNTLIPVAIVKEHLFDYYQIGEVPAEKVTVLKNYPRFRFSINGGISYMPAKISETIPSDFKEYAKELKSGYHFGMDANYYLTEPLGLGFKYIVFNTKNNIANIWVEDLDGNRRYGKMSDDMTITFFGPMFSARLLNSDKTNALFFGISIGYIRYLNDFVVIDDFEMTGNTAGIVYEIGYDIGLSEKVSLVFQLSSIAGNIFQYRLSDGVNVETVKLDGEDDQPISASHIDFSIGLRFNL